MLWEVFCYHYSAWVLLCFLYVWIYSFHQIWKTFNHFFSFRDFCLSPSTFLRFWLPICKASWHHPTDDWRLFIFFLAFYPLCLVWIILNPKSSSCLIVSFALSNFYNPIQHVFYFIFVFFLSIWPLCLLFYIFHFYLQSIHVLLYISENFCKTSVSKSCVCAKSIQFCVTLRTI